MSRLIAYDPFATDNSDAMIAFCDLVDICPGHTMLTMVAPLT